MKPPSDVTVLSESEPIPSLLPLLLDALLKNSSFPVRGTRNAASLRGAGSGAAAAFAATLGAAVVDIDGLRAARLSAATTFETDTDVVAGVSVGRRVLGERCAVGESISRDLRLGDEFDEWVPSPRRSGGPEAVLRRATASTEDELGTEDEIALGVLDAFALGEVDAIGLLPLFGDGVASGLIVGFDGVDILRTGVEGLEARAFGEVGTVDGALVGGRLREESRRSMSGGIGVPWTMFTAFHSAAWIMLYSDWRGGRQQPGHPGLL